MTTEDRNKMELIGKIFIHLELDKNYILVFEEKSDTKLSRILTYFKFKTK